MGQVELAPCPPHVEGPTWRKTASGEWWLPERSLAWGIVNWMAEFLRSPDGDGPFFPTLEQFRFLLWWYSVDENGKWLYRNGVCRRAKGTGKTPFAAAIALSELCGPVKFHTFKDGEPVGVPHPAAWITFAGVSQEQSKNMFSLFPMMVTPQMKQDYAIEINKTILYSGKGGRLEAVTSSAHTMEGNRPTLVLEDEIQWWNESNGGHDMRSVIDGNVTKVRGARRLSLCNAHIPGEDSVAERDYDYHRLVMADLAVDTGLLYDSIEAPANTPLSEIPPANIDPEGYERGVKQLMEGLRVARGDAVWLDLEQVTKAILDPRTLVSEARRRHLNQVNATEDAWISGIEWDKCQQEVQLSPGDKITLGFDGSKSNDWTALVACRVSDGALFLLKYWNPKNHPGEEVPRQDVDNTVRSAMNTYTVVGMRADVKEFESYVDGWSKDFGRKMKVKASPANNIAFDMRGNTKTFGLDCERFLDAVLEGELIHNGDRVMRQHVLNAKRHATQYDSVSIRKASKDSSRKIDIAVCAVLAWGSRHQYLISKNYRTGRALVVS